MADGTLEKRAETAARQGDALDAPDPSMLSEGSQAVLGKGYAQQAENLQPGPEFGGASQSQLGGFDYGAQIQMLRPDGGSAKATDGAVRETAVQGLTDTGGAMPHADAIQSAFGHHDIGGVEAHTGAPAQEAAQAIGAEAYTVGDQVAFNSASPSLHTAAHEAAHVVQQRGGVSLPGGVGTVGDSYEKQADNVADAVVAGESAQGLLGSGGGRSGAGAATQKKASSGGDKAVQMKGDKDAGDKDKKTAPISQAVKEEVDKDEEAPINSEAGEQENELSDERLDAIKQSGAKRSCRAAIKEIESLAGREAPKGSWLKEREFHWSQYMKITAIVAGLSKRARLELKNSGQAHAYLSPVPQAYFGHVYYVILKGRPRPMPPAGYEHKWPKDTQFQAAAKKMLQYCGSLGKAFDQGQKERGAVGNRDTIRGEELERYSTFFGFAGGELSAQDLEILEIYFQDACATSGDPDHSKWFDGALFGDKGDRVTAHMLNHTPYMPLQQEGGEGPPAREAQSDDEEVITLAGEKMTKGEAQDRLSLMRTRYLQLSDQGMGLVVYALRQETSYQRKQGNNYAHHLIEQFAQSPPDPGRWEAVRSQYEAAQSQLFAATTVDALPDAIEIFMGASQAFDAAKKPWGKHLDSYIDTGQEIYNVTKMVRDKAFAAASKGTTLYLMAKGHSRAKARAEVTASMAVLYGSANYLGQVLSDVEGGEVDWLEVFMETVEGLLVGFFNSDVKDPGGTLLGEGGPKRKDMITDALKSALKTALGHVRKFVAAEIKGRDPDDKKAAQARSKEVVKAAIDVGMSTLQDGLMGGIDDDVVGGGLVKAFSGVIKDVLNETLQKVAAGEEINSDDLITALLDSIGKISLDSVMGGGVDVASKKK